MLFTCQPGFEALLARELQECAAGTVTEQGPGWVQAVTSAPLDGLAFPHLTLIEPTEVRADSVNALAQQVAEVFFTSIRGERVDAAWLSSWSGPAEIVGLGRRISAVEAAFGERLRRKLSRVAKLATTERPRSRGNRRGLFVHFVDFGRAFVAREAWDHGPRRMADDPLAPSRSYLKIEEACLVLGSEPRAGETVCDLGAAPGGWSYSAARRGARVVAVDNGPLKGGALDHPLIEHRREDAFRFAASASAPFDWLFCDLVEEPHHVLQQIVEPWLVQRWCRRLVVNLKFGRVDAIRLLGEIRAAGAPLPRHVPGFHVAHLYHDREELTIVGQVAAGAIHR